MSRARVVVGILLLGAAVLVATRARAAVYETAPAGEGADPIPTPDTDWSLSDWIDHATAEIDTMPAAPIPSPDSQIRAFLQAIAWCEGTAGQSDPYRVCYAYSHVVQDLREHPAVSGEWKGERLTDSQCRGAGYGPGCVSTAAGKYQLIRPTWESVRNRLRLPDFSPASQDAAAVQLLRQCGAYDRIVSGDIVGAIARARSTWASLPGANYAGQGMRSQAYVAQAFRDAGGVLA